MLRKLFCALSLIAVNAAFAQSDSNAQEQTGAPQAPAPTISQPGVPAAVSNEGATNETPSVPPVTGGMRAVQDDRPPASRNSRNLPIAPAPSASTGTPRPTAQLTNAEKRAIDGLNAPPQIQPQQHVTRPRPQGIAAPPSTISLNPGQNTVFAIAAGNLNQLVTPFRKPTLMTSNKELTVTIEQNIVYVGTSVMDSPVGLYIHEVGDPSNTISVTLVPSDIPPISTKLILNGYVPNTSDPVVVHNGDKKLAKGWESEQSYTEALKATFRAIALGKIPDGYELETLKNSTPLMPNCSIAGARIEPKQLLTGFAVKTIVSRVTNVSPVPVDIDERTCNTDPVLAQTAWPRTHLAPGDSTEWYVAIPNTEGSDHSETQRPSLLKGVH